MLGDKSRNLLGAHEHTFNLCGLVCAAHPAFDTHIRPSTGALPFHNSAHVSRSEADQRIVRVECRHNNFAHLAWSHGIASSRAHNLYDDTFINNHAFHGRRLVGNCAKVCSTVALQTHNTTVFIFLTQTWEKRAAADSRLTKLQLKAHLFGLIQNELEVIGSAHISRTANVMRRLRLKLGLANTSRQNSRAYSACTVLKHHPCWRKVIRKTVLDNITRTNTSSRQKASRAPPVMAHIAGFIDRSWALKNMRKARSAHGRQPTKRWGLLLSSAKIRLA